MRMKVFWLSFAAAVASMLTSLCILGLLHRGIPNAVWITAGILALLVAVLLAGLAGRFAINYEIERLLSVRKMVRTLSQEQKLKEQPLSDYELAHPVRFIYKELEMLQSQMRHLQQQVQKHAQLFDNLEEAVVIADAEGKVISLNAPAKRVFHVGYEKGDLSLSHVLRNPHAAELLRAVMQQEKVFAQETIVDKSGTALDVAIGRVDSSKGQEGFLVFARDVTEQYKAQRVRDDFIANVSHELKTPLTSIKGFAELMLEGAVVDEPTKKRYLGLIQLEADRLTALINDVLKLSELSSIAMEEAKTTVDVAQMASEVADVLMPIAQQKHVKLNLHLSTATMQAHPVRIRELLMNLMENAIKYNRQNGQVNIHVDSADNQCKIVVADTGIGIPEKDRQRVFERFYRVDKSRSRQSGGTGLGLAIVKHIVDLYKGKITLQSIEGQGTRIEIIFPV